MWSYRQNADKFDILVKDENFSKCRGVMSLFKLAEKYFWFGLRFTGLQQSLKLSHIDFDRPWWMIALQRWFAWIVILSGRILSTVFKTLVPISVAFAFEKGESFYLGFTLLAWILVEGWRYFTIWIFDTEQARIVFGIHYSAYRFFLTVDPIYHAMRTSGKLFAKIERGAHAYEDLLMVFVYELVAIVSGIVTVICSLFVLNTTVGFISFAFLFSITVFNIVSVLFNSFSFENRFIKADDEMKSVSMESLVRIELVRSSFASDELNDSIRERNRFAGAILATHWISFGTAMLFTRIGYALSVTVLGLYVLSMIKSGAVSAAIGGGFLAAYINGSYDIMRIGNKSQKVMRCIIRVKDLFNFIRGFGQQTFPVLSDESPEKVVPRADFISIQADDLNFAYTKKAQIFEEHSLNLKVPEKQENKLYGIIGPSGIGKTTLISVLGGQLRPTTGTVKINDISMYDVGDETRRELVAMQGQTASNLSGTVRDSLLLGLPKNKELFPDYELIELLKRVGVWKIFQEKEGLGSAVGEGGLNLSVGQRQRLNFASLYLRTTHFKPFLILIDEPTSSLDEVSEQAITDMIDELAQNAVTFVIAHRLHTLERAAKILDVSLLAHDKDLVFYGRDELEKKSNYYRRLIGGEVAIED